jgi:hypothetical protein
VDQDVRIEEAITHGITTLADNEDISRLTVTRSNRLVEAQIRLSTREQKVLAACIALINPTGLYPDGIQVELTDDQIEALTGIEKRHIYRFIDDAAYNFHSIPIVTPGAEEGTVDYINIAHRSKYNPKDRKFRMHFHKDMEAELLQLSQYTSIHLKQIVAMKSKYSIRMFELIDRKYNPKKGGLQFFRMDLDELYFPLGIKNAQGEILVKTYTEKFKEFNRQVLKPAIDEINTDKTHYQVEMETFRTGRKVGGVIFGVRKKAVRLPGLSSGSVLEMLTKLGIKESVAQKWIKDYSEDDILANLDYLKQRDEMGTDIRNPMAYLNTLLKYNIASLPDIANPYSDQYKSQRLVRVFIQSTVMPIWWKLPEVYRDAVAGVGTFVDDPVAGNTLQGFVAAAKEGGVEEASMFYEPEMVLQDWLADYQKNEAFYAS